MIQLDFKNEFDTVLTWIALVPNEFIKYQKWSSSRVNILRRIRTVHDSVLDMTPRSDPF